MKIEELVKEAHEDAKEKGFWDEERSFAQLAMLVVTEVAEAVEAHRRGHHADWYDLISLLEEGFVNTAFQLTIKNSVEDEIADCFIRLADLCGGLNIDIEKHIKAKMLYNKTRENKHGRKY